jgi:hypothetical protein
MDLNGDKVLTGEEIRLHAQGVRAIQATTGETLQISPLLRNLQSICAGVTIRRVSEQPEPERDATLDAYFSQSLLGLRNRSQPSEASRSFIRGVSEHLAASGVTSPDLQRHEREMHTVLRNGVLDRELARLPAIAVNISHADVCEALQTHPETTSFPLDRSLPAPPSHGITRSRT